MGQRSWASEIAKESDSAPVLSLGWNGGTARAFRGHRETTNGELEDGKNPNLRRGPRASEDRHAPVPQIRRGEACFAKSGRPSKNPSSEVRTLHDMGENEMAGPCLDERAEFDHL